MSDDDKTFRMPHLFYNRQGQPVDDAPDLLRNAVAQTDVGNGWHVSTVFLGINHNWDPKGPPHIFESLVNGPNDEEETFRYSSEAEAWLAHWELVAKYTTMRREP